MSELYHHGIKGQKWGVRRTPQQLGYSPQDSKVTKRVKDDYNRMSDSDFLKKYKTTKSIYAKRVAKADKKGYDVYTRAKERNERIKKSAAYKYGHKLNTDKKTAITQMIIGSGLMAAGIGTAVYASKVNKGHDLAMKIMTTPMKDIIETKLV